MPEKSVKAFLKNYNKRKEILFSMGLFNYMKNTSGYVLIIVLIVISLLFTVSTEFLITAQTNINYLKKLDERLQAVTLAKAGINMASLILKADEKGWAQMFLGQSSADKNIDSYDDIWAIDFPDLPIEKGSLKLKIEDENSKINLSVLSLSEAAGGERTPYFGITQRFFLNLGFRDNLADAILDWVDPNDNPEPQGAELSDYQPPQFPYKPKNNEMDSINELLLVNGITPEIFYGLGGGNYGLETNLIAGNRGNFGVDTEALANFDTENVTESLKELMKGGGGVNPEIGKEQSRSLADYFRVNGNRESWLDESNKININTASYRVLSALTEKTTDDIVAEILNKRLSGPFKNVDEIKDLIDDATFRKNCLTVKSYIFKISSTGTINNTSVKITCILRRGGSGEILYWSEN